MINNRAHIAFKASIIVALGVLALVEPEAQSAASVLPVEPPSSLFSTRLGDSDVEVLAQGFWEASILSSGTLSVGADGLGFNPVPFLFTQTPDLYLYLRFRQKWLFETYLTQSMEDSRFSLAFEGGQNDFIRWARLGNSGIVMADYPYMAFGTPQGSFGFALSAHDPAEKLSIDAMVRWDGLSWKTRSFFGSAEAQETRLSPGDNLRGRRFVLPGAPVSTLSLTETSTAGVSRRLSADEYSVSLASGLIMLTSEPAGSLVAEYRSGGVARSETLYEFVVDARGTKTRKYQRYEARNLYALPDTQAARQLFVRRQASGLSDDSFTVTRVAPGLIQVLRADAVPDPDSDAYMRPFAAEEPWIYEEAAESVYSVGAGFAIVARVIESLDSIVMDQGTVAGTITVYRDDVESSSFTYDSQSRTLVLLPAPKPAERIEVRYAVSSTDRSDGALAFGLGSRFSWLGLDWFVATGGRWPLFGRGFDESGEHASAWAGVSGSVARESALLAFRLEAMGRYLQAGSSGLYRIAGMEEYASSRWLVPFRATGGDSALNASAPADASLASGQFKRIIDALHPDGLANRVLVIEAGPSANGAETRFIRHVDYVPLSSYRTLSFFVRAVDVPIGATLLLRIGDGQGGGAAVTLPLDRTGEGWRKVEFSLRPGGLPRVVDTDGSVVSIPGLSASYSELATAGLIELVVTGLTSGSLRIDEIVLEDSMDGFSGLASASLTAGDTKARKGLYFDGRASGILDEAPAVAARLEAGWMGPVLEAKAHATPALVSDRTSFGLGYSLAVPGATAPTRVADSFSRDVALSSYGRKLEAAFSASGFSMLINAASSERPAAFSQEWLARAAYRGLASLGAAASLASDRAVIGGLGLADTWYESWRLVLPADETSARSRRISLSTSVLDPVLSASAEHIFEAGEPARARAGARATIPVKLGIVTVAPYYGRKTSLDHTAATRSFMEDALDFMDLAGRASALWALPPLVELWKPGAFDGFAAFSAGASLATHRAELGFEIKRPIGYGLIDLFLPSSLDANLARDIRLSGDSAVESGIFSLALSGGAANIFAGAGVLPLLPGVKIDEYSGKTSLSLSYYPSDGAILPSVSSNLAASFDGGAGKALALSSNLAYTQSRSTAPWSWTAGFALATRPLRSWLGDLAGLAIAWRAEGKATEEASGTNWISSWLDSILEEPPALKDSYGFEWTLGRGSSPVSPLSLRLSLDYATRVVAAGALTLGAGARLWQQSSWYTDRSAFSAGYSLSLEAKLVF